MSGDPHLVTLDGLRYSLQAVGEFVLATNDRDLEIQTRFSPLQNSSIVSVVTAAALFTYKPGTSSATFVNPSFPSELVEIDDDERAAAKAACQRADVWLEPTLSQCTFDYAMTSDEHMIQLVALANHEAQLPRTKIVIDQPGGVGSRDVRGRVAGKRQNSGKDKRPCCGGHLPAEGHAHLGPQRGGAATGR